MNKTISWLQNYSTSRPIQITQATRQQIEELRSKFSQLNIVQSCLRTVEQNKQKE